MGVDHFARWLRRACANGYPGALTNPFHYRDTAPYGTVTYQYPGPTHSHTRATDCHYCAISHPDAGAAIPNACMDPYRPE